MSQALAAGWADVTYDLFLKTTRTSQTEPGLHDRTEEERLELADLIPTGLRSQLEALNPLTRWAEKIEEAVEQPAFQQDPEYLAFIVPSMRLFASHFGAEVRDLHRLPDEGGALLVGNHSGGGLTPDTSAVWASWYEERGYERALIDLGFGAAFTVPILGDIMRKIGQVPAREDNAGKALDEGLPVLVYPGGDQDLFRPWTERNKVDFHGRAGFVKLALRRPVPIFPVYLPLPAKILVQVCGPIDFREFGSRAADDPKLVQQCYDYVLRTMQETLDALVEEVPHPLLSGLRSWLPGVAGSGLRDWSTSGSLDGHVRSSTSRTGPRPDPIACMRTAATHSGDADALREPAREDVGGLLDHVLDDASGRLDLVDQARDLTREGAHVLDVTRAIEHVDDRGGQHDLHGELQGLQSRFLPQVVEPVVGRTRCLSRVDRRPPRVLVGGVDDGLLLDVERAALLRGQEAGPHPDPHAPHGEGGGQAAAIPDPARREHGGGGSRVDRLRPERHRSDTTRVTSGLVSLGDHQVGARSGDPRGILRIARNAQHLHADPMRGLDHEAGIAEPGAEERHTLVDAHLDGRVGTRGRRTAADDGVAVGQPELFLDLREPLAVGRWKGVQGIAQCNVACALRGGITGGHGGCR